MYVCMYVRPRRCEAEIANNLKFNEEYAHIYKWNECWLLVCVKICKLLAQSKS